MEDDRYFEFLEILYKAGVGKPVDMVEFMNGKFPINKDYGSFGRDGFIREFLSDIEEDGYINYQYQEVYNEKYPSMIPYGFTISASITIGGFQFLNDVKRDKSTLDTNSTIRKQSKLQTIVLIFAALFSLGSLVVSLLNYCATNEKSSQIQYLQLPKGLLDTLKQDMSLLNSKKFHPIEARKNLPKKP